MIAERLRKPAALVMQAPIVSASFRHGMTIESSSPVSATSSRSLAGCTGRESKVNKV